MKNTENIEYWCNKTMTDLVESQTDNELKGALSKLRAAINLFWLEMPELAMGPPPHSNYYDPLKVIIVCMNRWASANTENTVKEQEWVARNKSIEAIFAEYSNFATMKRAKETK